MSNETHHVNRRDFIAAGSLAVAGLALPTSKAIAATATAEALPFSVGFRGGVPRSIRRFLSATDTFDAAETILNSDATLFSLGAKLSFRGISTAHSQQRRAVFIDWVQTTGDGTSATFFAFTHVDDGKTARSSPPSKFELTVPTQGTVDLRVRSQVGTEAEAASTVAFAINSAAGAYRLNRGVYIIALTATKPDWRSIRFADGMNAGDFVTGGKPLLVSAITQRPVDFEYVVMTVGAASTAKE